MPFSFLVNSCICCFRICLHFLCIHTPCLILKWFFLESSCNQTIRHIDQQWWFLYRQLYKILLSMLAFNEIFSKDCQLIKKSWIFFSSKNPFFGLIYGWKTIFWKFQKNIFLMVRVEKFLNFLVIWIKKCFFECLH